ncbi:hypothetical protein RUM44_002179 [Polyplax serrata]|uniref:Uncharacterized protein n=1 Tax=Polyplax serrata TaxID=468196 RepID=A0ABR1ANW8_POLSC
MALSSFKSTESENLAKERRLFGPHFDAVLSRFSQEDGHLLSSSKRYPKKTQLFLLGLKAASLLDDDNDNDGDDDDDDDDGGGDGKDFEVCFLRGRTGAVRKSSLERVGFRKLRERFKNL